MFGMTGKSKTQIVQALSCIYPKKVERMTIKEVIVYNQSARVSSSISQDSLQTKIQSIL